MGKLGLRSGGRLILSGGSEMVALAEMLSRSGFETCPAESPLKAQRAMRDTPPDALLVSPGTDDRAAMELCRSVKLDPRSSFISVLWVNPVGLPTPPDIFEAGVDDVISADAPEPEILLRLNRAVRFKRASDSLEDANAVIIALANAVEGKDHYTCGHVERVGEYSVQIARRLGLGSEDLAALRTGGVVHDIGKIGIPDQILNKPGKLTDEEMAVMRRHPVIGHDILQPLRTFQSVLPIVRWHHERPNGTGYPDGLDDARLPMLPRIIAVADVFDALSTDRPYRAALPMEKCRAILSAAADNGELDATVVRTLFDVLGSGLGMIPTAAA